MTATTTVEPPAPDPGDVRTPWSRRFSIAGADLGPRERRILVAILAVGFVVRLVWAVWATRTPGPAAGDTYSYYFLGRSMAEGDGYVHWVTGDPTAYYPVGYPAILAVLFWFVLHTPIPDNLAMAGSLLNVVLGTLSVALVFVIASRAFDATVGLVAAALFALFPNPVYFVATTQIETTFIFTALAAIAIIVTHDWSAGPPSRNRLLAFGVALGIATVVRPFALPFLGGLVLAMLIARHGWRPALAAVGWVMIPVVLLAVPWTIRNIVVMDSPVLFSTNLGDTACLDRFDGANGRFRWADHEGCVDPETPEVERNSGNLRKAVRYVLDDPGRELYLIQQRFVRMMDNDHDGALAVESGGPWLGERVRSTLVRLGDWYFRVVGVLGLVGIVFLFRRKPERVIVLVALGVLLVIPALLWGNPRFHLPVLPFAAMTAAATLAWSARRVSRGAGTSL